MHLPASGGEGARVDSRVSLGELSLQRRQTRGAEDACRLSLQLGAGVAPSPPWANNTAGVKRGPELSWSWKRNRVSPYRSPLGREAERQPITVRVEEERKSKGHSVMEWIPFDRMRKQADFSLVFCHEEA